MKFFTAFALCLLLALTHSAPLENRATVQITGSKVSVLGGLLINYQYGSCFQNSGLELAKAWAAAIADQWTSYASSHQMPFHVEHIDAMYASESTSHLYCTSVNAIYTFASPYGATAFATFARGLMGNTKRSEDGKDGLNLGDVHPEVYVAGIDLPADHHYFGPATNGTTTPAPALPKSDLAKRSWGSCSNNKCGFSFTSDQTGRCRDSTFPARNYYHCG